MTSIDATNALPLELGTTNARELTYYAGFWRRAVAAAIDGALMLVLVVGCVIALGGNVVQVNDRVMIERGERRVPLSEFAAPDVVVTRDGRRTTTVETTTTTVGLQRIHSVVTRTAIEQAGGAPRTSVDSNLSIMPSWEAFALFFALWILYASVLEASRLQATLGKLAMFIRVCDDEGRRVTLRRACTRNVLKAVSTISLGVGYLMAGWTARKQALHDIVAGCLVKLNLG